MTFANLGIAVTSNADRAAVDLDKLTAASARAEAGAQRLGAAASNTMRPIIQQAPLATDAIKGTAFQTANVAAQFQDIAVQLQAGQSPFIIALQQGTQLGAVLGAQGGGVRGALGGVAAGFASIISPVNLATIGLIAFGGIAVQALSGLAPTSETATEALKRHSEQLLEIVRGYSDAEDAVRDYADARSRLPVGAAASELQKEFADLNKEAEKFAGYARDFGTTLSASAGSVEQQVGALLRSFGNGQRSAADLVTELTLLGNTDLGPLGFILRAQLIDPLIDAAQKARAVEDALVNLSHVAAGLGESTDLRFALDNRTEAQRSAASHQIELDALKAKTPAQMRDIAMRRERLKLADEEISEALREQKVREAGELAFARAQANAGKAATKDFDQWGNSTRDFQKRIDQTQAQIDLMGKGTFEVERQKAALELRNRAADAGIKIDERVSQQIDGLATNYARATAELERLTEAYEFGRDTFRGFVSDLKSGLQEGQSLWESLGNAAANALDKIADRALSMAADGIFDMIFGAVMGGITGGMGGGKWNIPTSFVAGGFYPGLAGGGTVARAGLSWVGEDGPELLRLPQGAQVTPHRESIAMAANQNGGGGINISNVTIHANSEKEGAAAARGFAAELNRHFPAAMERYQRNPLRRAGG